MNRALNVVYATMVEEARANGWTRQDLHDRLDELADPAHTAPRLPDDDAAGLKEMMGGLTMDDLLGDD